MVKILKEHGCNVTIGDSPGGTFSKNVLRSVYEKSGLRLVAEETGAELSYDTGWQYVSCPENKLIKKFEITNMVLNADAVITMPKLKTHMLTHFTGATKILFGAIPGVTKAAYHAKLKTVDLFSEMLVDLLDVVKPRLAIMDGVVGMEGDGPSRGKPRTVGVILAGEDSVALDVVACNLIGMRPETVPILKAAMARGLTTCDLSDIEIRGASIGEVAMTDFAKPATGGGDVSSVPSYLRRMFTNAVLVRPHINKKICIGCGVCMKNCPAKAITISEKKASIDQDKCIRCYCCHELCQEKAVELRKSLTARIFAGR
jgi:uncharacterized protein (DUF362 family)/NAD-dependent dihydropyrimidine dehydrogenase PreA subunit